MIRCGRESVDSWRMLLENLPGRGLRPPVLVVHDGNAGLIKALKSAWPGVPRPLVSTFRCLTGTRRRRRVCRTTRMAERDLHMEGRE